MARKRSKPSDQSHSRLHGLPPLPPPHVPAPATAPPSIPFLQFPPAPAPPPHTTSQLPLPLPVDDDDEPSPLPAISAHLVGPSFFPNSVKWSEDNLIAVATSQLVTILNPAFIEGPRGSISASSEQPFKMGTIQPKDLQAPCILPICLARDTKAIVRSMDWSPQGFSPSGGCMLAVCSRDFRVKLYRAPHKEFQCEWFEVLDLSDILYQHLFKNKIKSIGQKSQKSKQLQSESFSIDVDQGERQAIAESELVNGVSNYSTSPQQDTDSNIQGGVEMNDYREALNADCRTRHPVDVVNAVEMVPLNDSVSLSTEQLDNQISRSQATGSQRHQNRFEDLDLKDCKSVDKEVMIPKISPHEYMKNSNSLAFVVVACSPTLNIKVPTGDPPVYTTQNMTLIALGSKSGEVFLLRMTMPKEYTLEKVPFVPEVSFVCVFEAHVSWVTALSWSKGYNNSNNSLVSHEEVLLVTGSCDGSVKLWVGASYKFQAESSNSVPLTLVRKVISEDSIPVTTVAMILPDLTSNTLQIAVGKASGGVYAFRILREDESFSEAHKHNAHSQLVTGIVWAFRGRCLYSCSQDNRLQAWKFSGNDLVAICFPEDSSFDAESLEDSSALSNSVLDGYFGVDISKGNLSLATVRGVSSELLDQMYQSRAMKAVAQMFWIGGQSFDTTNPFVRENGRTNIISWEENILAALHHFENPANKLVLWDIITSLRQVSSVGGVKFMNSVVSRWLFSLGLVDCHSEDETFLSCSSKFKGTLWRVSCRSLQIVYVIFKRLYLAENRDKSAESSVLNCQGSNSDSECHKRKLEQFVLDVEQELKERLVHVIYASKCLKLQKYTENENVNNSIDDFYGLMTMWQWAISNSTRISFELQYKLQMLAQLDRSRDNRKMERCYICQSDIPFISTESGCCQGNQPHKLPRCSVTFKICPQNCWFCYCCSRWASQLTPRVFLSLPSKLCLEMLHESDLLETNVEAICPFCGILMQRFVPDFLLRLSLT